jgi:hypothetical protein
VQAYPALAYHEIPFVGRLATRSHNDIFPKSLHSHIGLVSHRSYIMSVVTSSTAQHGEASFYRPLTDFNETRLPELKLSRKDVVSRAH